MRRLRYHLLQPHACTYDSAYRTTSHTADYRTRRRSGSSTLSKDSGRQCKCSNQRSRCSIFVFIESFRSPEKVCKESQPTCVWS